MLNIDEKKVCSLLNKALLHELAGVNLYTHYALMVHGYERLSLVNYFKNHATESLNHAFKAGELITGLNGHPNMETVNIAESNKHDLKSILEEAFEHETKAAAIYYQLLDEVKTKSVFLEEYARSMIAQEEQHILEMRKLSPR